MANELLEAGTEAAIPGTGFTKAHQLFRETVRRFVDQEINPYVDTVGRSRDISRARTVQEGRATWGSLGSRIPQEYGGMGGDYWYNLAMAEELARVKCGGIPMAIHVQTDMATPALNQYGSHELKKKYLEPAIRGDAVCSIAVTEAGAGSDVASIRTKAEREGDEYVINGSKMYITNGAQADWLCLLARTSPGKSYQGNVADHRAHRRERVLRQQETEKDGKLGQRHRRVGVRQRARARLRIASAKRGRASSIKCSSFRTSG